MELLLCNHKLRLSLDLKVLLFSEPSKLNWEAYLNQCLAFLSNSQLHVLNQFKSWIRTLIWQNLQTLTETKLSSLMRKPHMTMQRTSLRDSKKRFITGKLPSEMTPTRKLLPLIKWEKGIQTLNLLILDKNTWLLRFWRHPSWCPMRKKIKGQCMINSLQSSSSKSKRG